MILIVGGAGYIGSHVNKLLNQGGFSTVVFDNLIRGHKSLVKWGRFFQGDLANRGDIDRCFNGHPIKAVMHFGAFAYVGESVSEPAKYYNNNVSNTLNLLESMVAHKVKHFIFSSTCSTYGIPAETPITENHPQKPINPYGRSKLMVEEILKDFDKAYGIKHVILRYFNAAGADPDGEIGEIHNPETHLIPLAIDAAINNTEIRIFGTDHPTPDGTCIRDYIHVNDLADAHIKALERLGNTNVSESFNLGNGRGYSVREVITTVGKISKKTVKAVNAPKREGDPAILISDSKKAHDVLKWRPAYPDLENIVGTAWQWHSGKKDKYDRREYS